MPQNHWFPTAETRVISMYHPLPVAEDHALAEVIVDLSAVRSNVSLFVDAAPSAELMAVVKADAYNHGALPVARACLESGATQLGTATVGEALSLREAGISAPITAWMWVPGEDLKRAVLEGITIGVPSPEHAEYLVTVAEQLADDAAKAGTGVVQLEEAPHRPEGVAITLMIDTGLSRSGITPDQWESVVNLIALHRDLFDVRGVMSHLASADDSARAAFTDVQNRRFKRAIEICHDHGIHPSKNHIANTPAALTRPDLHHHIVRPGVGIYGVDPVVGGSGGKAGELRPAITFRAKVITTKIIRAGESVSYGSTWTATRDTRTAVIAAGYADGVPRTASGKFKVGIGGKLYLQIGRVCMDQIVVNLGDAEEPSDVQPGDWATIFGEGGISASELAAAAGTIDYEVLTMPRGARVWRRWKGQENNALDLKQDSGEVVARTPEDMREVGCKLGVQLEAGTVVVLTGPLGAGKTTLTQGIAAGLGVKGRVKSPTFTIVRTHKPGEEGQPGMLHMDAYRLLGADVAEEVAPGEHIDRDTVLDALESLDIDSDLDQTVVVAEWGRGVVETLSDKVLDVEIDRQVKERSLRWEWR